MRKFLAVVKHEYKKVVLKWSFLIATFMLPFIAVLFAVVPAIIFSLKGEPVRIVVVDPSGKVAPRIKENLSEEKIREKVDTATRDSLKDVNPSQQEKIRRSSAQMAESFVFVDYDPNEKSNEQIRRELTGKIINGELDAYLLIPSNFDSPDATFEFRSRKAGDLVGGSTLTEALNEAVKSQRLANANISEDKLRDASRPVKIDEMALNEKGEEKDNSGTFAAAFAIGLMIYITLAIYGQAIMAAVVEEKETRIAEILFSSARPFSLMLGKLVGVGLAGLTQLAIWVISATLIAGVALVQLDAAGMGLTMPDITPLMFFYFFVFFILGFFIYASIFALIGSMVTTVQEGGQFAFPPIMILLAGFYLSFAVIRDPNSNVSFWASIAPFFAPITMPVRILAETPPFWQIALAMLINGIAIAGLVWLASRVYRVGMLMYGKRASIPEVWKWIRQP